MASDQRPLARSLLERELEDFGLDDEELDEAVGFALEVRDLAQGVAEARGDGAAKAVAGAARLLATNAIDEEIRADRASGDGPACAPGCSACCHLPVSVTAADVALLLAWLAQQTDEVREDIERRVAAALPHATGARPRGPLACPLLDPDAGTCLAYEARPLACRGCFSDDASRCVPGGTITTFVLPQVVARSAAVGARLALAEHGLDSDCRDLIVALGDALGSRA